jgi:UPF0716 family protein affecting phage T7 exclusion
MLNNAGKKIVFWSHVVLYAGIAVSLILGFWLVWNGAQANAFRFTYTRAGYLYNTGMMGGGRVVVAGFLVIILGSLASWLTALLLRAFGDLAEDTRAIRERLEWTPAETEAPVDAKAEEPAEPEAKAPAKPRTRRPAKPKAEAPAESESAEK